MREIKFRAWLEGVHENLTFLKTSMKYDVVLSSQGNYCNVGYEPWDIQGEYKTIPIMQFTGLKDKDNVDIYEGDVLLIVNLDINIVVAWSALGACWACKDALDGENYGLLSAVYAYESQKAKYSIIGNIYENPELLKNKVNI